MVFHPLIRLLVTRPEWAVEHAGAYAQLAAAEGAEWAHGWKRAGVMWAAMAGCAFLTLVFTGFAVMVSSAIPAQQMPSVWGVWAVPIATGLLTLVLYLVVTAHRQEAQRQPVFSRLREQAALDAALMKR